MHFNWNEDTLRWFQEASEYTGYDRHMAELLLPYLDDCKTVCDIGCGMALVDFELAPSFDSVTCIDTHPEVIRYITERAAKEDVKNLTCRCEDGMSMEAHALFDAVLALFHGDIETIGLKYLSYARKKLIMVVHADSHGSTGPKGYRVRKCCDTESTRTWLEAQNLSYEFRDAELEFGQPHRSLEDAIAYTRVFTKGAPEDELTEYVKSHVVETGRDDFPLYTPKVRRFGIFVITH